jgi:hypothetical protein
LLRDLPGGLIIPGKPHSKSANLTIIQTEYNRIKL